MAKASEIVKVKADDINTESMALAAKGNATAGRKSTSTGANCWAITALWLNQQKPLGDYDASKDVKDIAKDIRETFKSAFQEEHDIPEGGRNARTGKMMDSLIDAKTGELKWSSWEETKLPIQYCTDIAQVVKAGLVDELLVSETSVRGKSYILKDAKGAEPAMKTIQRSLELIDKKYKELNDKDLRLASDLIDKLLSDLNEHREACKLAKAA